ncbi:MAG TPA: SlyX family protein [Kofleriaceae bacterium]|nr:SlyX family protein [Kofleriaceae bacterium]
MADTVEELSDRLIDLEVKLAFQDRTITALDDVVRALVAKVEHLTRRVDALEKPPVEP